MNNEQRKRLQEALDIVVAIKDEEQTKADNLSDKFQEKADAIQEIADLLEEAETNITEAMEHE